MSRIENSEIWYNGVRFPSKDVRIFAGQGGREMTVTIAPVRLSDILVPDSCNWATREAQYVDESIFYYCDEREWNLPEEQLVELLENVYD